MRNIPYGRQTIDDSDIQAVAEVLRSDWLTQGPKVQEFEEVLASCCGARYAVVFSSGTAALHGAYAAAGLGAGDELVTTPLTFAATANASLYLGSRPVFADVEEETGLLDPDAAEKAGTVRTKALVSVDYAGQPADYDRFRALCRRKGWVYISDACHSLGADYKGKKVGSLADMTVFSFHPVKSLTTGEGGAVLTSDENLYQKLKCFRQHGIVKQGIAASPGDWHCEMRMLGFNYRLTDIQCALGISQLKKLDHFITRRRRIAERYNESFKGIAGIRLLPGRKGCVSSWHLYPVRVPGRAEVFKKLRQSGIGVQVHYAPVYQHPYYRSLGYEGALCSKAEAFYQGEISLPIFPLLSESDQDKVIEKLKEIMNLGPGTQRPALSTKAVR